MSRNSRKRSRRKRPSYRAYDPFPAVDRTELLRALLNPEALLRPGAKPRPRILPEIFPRPRSSWRWVSPGEAVSVAGFTIPGGMLYVGGGLPSLNGRTLEPALIDPDLPVNRARPDRSGARTSYWTSYADIPPTARAAYLGWLADGRRAPGTATAYLHLFFYGLERRLLADLGPDGDPEERDALLAEVERLLGLYGADYIFRSHAERLLDIVRAVDAARAPLGGPPPVRSDRPADPYYYRSAALPMGLSLGLGRFAAEGLPLPADWAVAWMRHEPEVRLRSPAWRAPEEFDALFTLRYGARHGAGIMLKPGYGVLSLRYYPASPSFGGEARLTTDIAPVSQQGRVLQRLTAVAEGCANELEPFSRRRGYDLKAPPTLAALAYLPAELLRERTDESLMQLMGVVARALDGNDDGELDATDLIARWPAVAAGRLTRAEATALAELLAKLGIGIEPDVRFGGPIPVSGGRVILFRLTASAAEAPQLGYGGDAALVQLAATVAAADGPPNDAQRRAVEGEVERLPALRPAERARLRLHARWALTAGLGIAGAKARVSAVAVRDAGPIVRFLVRVAAADGGVSPAEITLLRKLFALFGLPPEDVYSEIHALAVGADEPVTIRPAAIASAGYRIPAPRAREVRLDPTKVRRKEEESAQVSALLSEVFAEDEAPAAPPPIPAGETAAGLDPAHTTLLRRLAAAPAWSRADAAALARELSLLLDGALDAINDAAFDAIGAPVWEGDDPIEIDGAAIARLLDDGSNADR